MEMWSHQKVWNEIAIWYICLLVYILLVTFVKCVVHIEFLHLTIRLAYLNIFPFDASYRLVSSSEAELPFGMLHSSICFTFCLLSTTAFVLPVVKHHKKQQVDLKVLQITFVLHTKLITYLSWAIQISC